jgi:hypothetical protein
MSLVFNPALPYDESMIRQIRLTFCRLVPVTALLLGSPIAHAADAARDQARFFEQEVRPLLADNCYSCHGPKKQKGGLRLDSRETVLRGGESGPAAVPGKPAESPLVEAINYAGLEMPPTGKLADSKIAVLTRWVALGMPWPAGAKPESAAEVDETASPVAGVPTRTKAGIDAADHAFWSFQPLRDVPAPETPADRRAGAEAWLDWPRTTIDRFILNAMLDHGLVPSAEADRRTLIRRLTFDLTGLPPTIEEIENFVADPNPDAYERLVDRLLGSPRYGERWARHWLDLVRYADSDGHRQDAYRPDAWRYRDYVVRSFNTDTPYDRFVAEQLAGDELDPEDPELRVAAGYLRLGTYEYNQRNVRGQWAEILNDITDVTGEVFLGLSIGCARCHDHKFDPILQKDYYRLQAFFTPLLPRDDLDLSTRASRSEYETALAAWERATAALRDELAKIEKPHRETAAMHAIAIFPDDMRPIFAKPESRRTPLERQLFALAYRQVAYEQDHLTVKGPDKARWEAVRKELKRFDSLKPAPPDSVMTVTDVGPTAPPTVIAGDRRREPIAPGFLSVVDPSPAPIEKSPAAPDSTGRRLTLARWIGRPDNMLSTRVVVNRIWQYHFGTGIVSTSSDFGRLGEAPSHPELLDHLASAFVGAGWSFKSMHRAIVTSSVYRQSSVPISASPGVIDPANRWLSHFPSRRLDAEEIRDSALAISGDLDPVLGGPGPARSSSRRSIDSRMIRNAPDPVLTAFDSPDGSVPISLRITTTTPTQALLLLNGEWMLARSQAMAGRLERLVPDIADRPARIGMAYRLAFGREPEPDEIHDAVEFLDRQEVLAGKSIAKPARAALADLCHTLLNSNEFLYVE